MAPIGCADVAVNAFISLADREEVRFVTDAEGRPLRFFMTAGQVSDYTGAAALLVGLPKAEW